MPVNLSIKNVPDDWVERLRQRAARHHRSLQGELMSIIEQSLQQEEALTPAELLARLTELGIQTPDESAGFVREDRDAH